MVALWIAKRFVRVSRIPYWFLLVFIGLICVPIGFHYFPIDPAYDTQGIVQAGIFGGLGGMVGGLVGFFISKAFQKNGKRKSKDGFSVLTTIMVILGVFVGHVADTGSSMIVTSGLAELLGSDRRLRTANEITKRQLEAELLEDPAMGPALKHIKDHSPRSFDRYISQLLVFSREAEDEGSGGEDLYYSVTVKASEYSNSLIPYLNDDKIRRVIDVRTLAVREMYNAKPQACTYPLFKKPYPKELMGKIMSSPEALSVIVEILGEDKGQIAEHLGESEFNEVTVSILDLLYESYGESVLVFVEPNRVTEQTASKYCEIEVEFYEILSRLPIGLKEPYFRTLMRTVSEQS